MPCVDSPKSTSVQQGKGSHVTFAIVQVATSSLTSKVRPTFPSHFYFLDASLHLYKRVCPSVRQSVRNAFVMLLLKIHEVENFMCRNDLEDIEEMDNIKTAL